MKAELIGLSEILNGSNKLITIAGRPAMGKTALALQIAINEAQKDKTVLYYSMEMPATEVSWRILNNITRNKFNYFKKKQITEIDKSLIDTMVEISKYPIFVNDQDAYSIPEIFESYAQHASLQKVDLIIIDYLQLLKYPVRDDEMESIKALVEEIKELANKINCPVIILSQLNRGPEHRDDKRPILEDMRPCSLLAEASDCLAFIYRDGFYNKDIPDDTLECNVVKNRTGKCETYIWDYNPEGNRIGNLPFSKNETSG